MKVFNNIFGNGDLLFEVKINIKLLQIFWFPLQNVQHLPWESIPVLRNTSVSRLPSVYFMHTELSYLNSTKMSVQDEGIEPGNVYYVLNPDSNLPHTQKTFADWFTG